MFSSFTVITIFFVKSPSNNGPLESSFFEEHPVKHSVIHTINIVSNTNVRIFPFLIVFLLKNIFSLFLIHVIFLSFDILHHFLLLMILYVQKKESHH